MVKKIVVVFVICLLAALTLLLFYQYKRVEPLREGLAALKEENYSDALKKLEPLAKKGDLTARFFVAEMYVFGLGVEIDIDIAKKWLSCDGVRSCINGRPEYKLAHVFASNRDFNKEKATYWMKISSDKGYKKADEWLAVNAGERKVE
ncbi:MAG: sel1 repeat family protein [Micavibrio sp.]|nr:MAG: sel1 repeat family protein [Micavibrio sp.]